MNVEKFSLWNEKLEDALNARNPRVVHKVNETTSAPFGIEKQRILFCLVFSYLILAF